MFFFKKFICTLYSKPSMLLGVFIHFTPLLTYIDCHPPPFYSQHFNFFFNDYVKKFFFSVQKFFKIFSYNFGSTGHNFLNYIFPCPSRPTLFQIVELSFPIQFSLTSINIFFDSIPVFHPSPKNIFNFTPL